MAADIDSGYTDARGHIRMTIPASALATWNYFFVNCAGRTTTRYMNAGVRLSTGTTSTPLCLGYEIINPYTKQNVCGGTSEYWFTKSIVSKTSVR